MSQGTYKPVLEIADGDTVITTTVDYTGRDASDQPVMPKALLAYALGSKSTGSVKLEPVGSMRRNREIANVATWSSGSTRRRIPPDPLSGTGVY